MLTILYKLHTSSSLTSFNVNRLTTEQYLQPPTVLPLFRFPNIPTLTLLQTKYHIHHELASICTGSLYVPSTDQTADGHRLIAASWAPEKWTKLLFSAEPVTAFGLCPKTFPYGSFCTCWGVQLRANSGNRSHPRK